MFRTRRYSTLPWAALAAALMLAVSPAIAATEPESQGDVRETTVSDKVRQGIAGLTLGILEVPGTIVEQSRENGPIIGIAVGLTQGVGRFVTREMVGLYQLLSAPFGAMPAGTQDPAYPWQRFETEGEDQLAATDPLGAEATELGWIRGIEVERAPGALIATFPADLLFEISSAKIESAAEPRLIGLAETLLRHPDTLIEVQGHSDATGPADFNVELSKKRAEAVREFLLVQGLTAERIQTAGFGASRPVASNSSLEGRRANRRVGVQLTKPVAALD